MSCAFPLRSATKAWSDDTVVITSVAVADTRGGPPMERVVRKIDVFDRSWQDQANCLGVDPDLFFPERGASTREAKEVCRGCVVRLECLEIT